MTKRSVSADTCDYCGLPVPGRRWVPRREILAREPKYCCSGCRFAASVLASDAGEGAVRHTLLKVGLGVFFAMNVMVFSMALWTTDVYGDSGLASGPLAGAVQDVFRYAALVFCLPVLFLLGEPIVTDVWQAIRRGVITTDLLLIIGVASAVAYSVRSVVSGQGQVYFDVATMILLFVTIGRWFEANGKSRSNELLDGIARLLPDTVRVIRDGCVSDVPRESLRVGERLRVGPGERFGVDGVILAGAAFVDEQIVTGESRPVRRSRDDQVKSGTLNIDGDLEVGVTAAAGKETVSRILDLVRRARRARGQHQKLADRVTAWFVPIVAAIAVAAAWWQIRHSGWEAGIVTGLAVTLIACPCALGLATPMTMWVALGRAASGHVLFRHAPSLEQLAAVRALLWDKTGTLTTGTATVKAFVTNDPHDESAALDLAAQLADLSTHSYSAAIRRFAGRRDQLVAIDEIRTHAGRGVSARLIAGADSSNSPDRALLGSLQWLMGEGYRLSAKLREAAERAGGGDSPLSCVGWGRRVRGIFIFQEDLRPEVTAVLGSCRDLGLSMTVVTGDRKSHAERLAANLKIPVFAEQLPGDKVEAVQEARRRFGAVAMIGDGINDAPALAASDIGIALGCGADLTRESAAVCLLTNDLARLPWTIELSRQTVRIIRQSLCWSFAYNIAGIALAATGNLSPVFSAMAMVASSVFVVTNSLRLNRFPEPATGTIEAKTHSGDALVGAAGSAYDAISAPPVIPRELQLT